ncbi:unnamed protein product [Toxocara canis]|uniref:Uncharacterized protein n=1 Tax=Toxocara canis TaxID=6265 RepID=A0A3P7HGK8_TOXCA|nr:unnamed protein product [Toxocara canis]
MGPCGTSDIGRFSAVYNRAVRIGDVGIVSSRNYASANSVVQRNVTYTMHTFSPIPFVVDVVKAEIESLAELDIITYPPLIVHKR